MNSNWGYSTETPNLDQIWRFLESCDLEIWRMTFKNDRALLLSNIKLCQSFHHNMWIQTVVTVRKRLSWVLTSVNFTFDLSPWPFAWPCDLEIWRMTFKNNGAPLPCYFKLCAAFHSHWWIQTGVTVWKRPIWVKFDDFYSRVTLKFDIWPSKTLGLLLYATSSFGLHFVAIGEIKLELQSGNA